MGTATEASVDARRPQHFIAGDGLRGIACLGVVLFHLSVGAALRYGDLSQRFGHSYGDIPGGLLVALRIAVPVFFALSGYLVGGPFVRAWIEEKRLPSFGKYAERRIRRIVPAFWLVLTYLFIRHGAVGTSVPRIIGMYGFQHTMYGDVAHFPFLAYSQQLWTVDVEMYFYLLTPLLALGLVVLLRRVMAGPENEERRRTVAIVALVVSGIVSVWVAGHVYSEGVTGKSILAWWASFVPGMLLASVEVPARERLPGTALGRRIALACLAIAIISTVGLGRLRPTSYHLVPIADIAGGGFLVVSAMFWQWTTGGAWRFLQLRPVQALGRWSFGIYLWHLAVIYELYQHVAPHRFTPAHQVALLLIPTWGLSIALGALSWHFIEDPIIRRAKKPVPAEAAVLA